MLPRDVWRPEVGLYSYGAFRRSECVNSKGPNFAGHYFVVNWGCGSGCLMLVIVDAMTGASQGGMRPAAVSKLEESGTGWAGAAMPRMAFRAFPLTCGGTDRSRRRPAVPSSFHRGESIAETTKWFCCGAAAPRRFGTRRYLDGTLCRRGLTGRLGDRFVVGPEGCARGTLADRKREVPPVEAAPRHRSPCRTLWFFGLFRSLRRGRTRSASDWLLPFKIENLLLFGAGQRRDASRRLLKTG